MSHQGRFLLHLFHQPYFCSIAKKKIHIVLTKSSRALIAILHIKKKSIKTDVELKLETILNVTVSTGQSD